MRNVVEFFQTGQWNFEWTPLTEGFTRTMKKLPDILDREILPFEKALKERSETLKLELGGDFKQFIEGKKMLQMQQAAIANLAQPGDKNFIGPLPKQGQAELIIDAKKDLEGKGSGKAQDQRNELLKAGSTNAYAAISAFRSDANKKTPHQQQVEKHHAQQAKQQSKSIETQQKQLDQLNKLNGSWGGLKVVEGF